MLGGSIRLYFITQPLYNKLHLVWLAPLPFSYFPVCRCWGCAWVERNKCAFNGMQKCLGEWCEARGRRKRSHLNSTVWGMRTQSCSGSVIWSNTWSHLQWPRPSWTNSNVWGMIVFNNPCTMCSIMLCQHTHKWHSVSRGEAMFVQSPDGATVTPWINVSNSDSNHQISGRRRKTKKVQKHHWCSVMCLGFVLLSQTLIHQRQRFMLLLYCRK